MRAQRGAHELTLYNYSIPIRTLLRHCGEDPRRLNARHLRQFVLKQSRNKSWTVAQRCTPSLRMFLRFLIAEGRCRAGLPPEDIERIIHPCDVGSTKGRRDREILLLLAPLGLRAGHIVHTRLHDID